MNIIFRTDASLEIGTGHVMRCLTLARALRDAGGKCRFVTRDLPGHLGDQIASEGFKVALLPAPDGHQPEGPPVHAAWAGVPWEKDAQQTRAKLLGFAADWLVLDHYSFDARWQQAALTKGTKLLVIDDLADRPHICDLLLDQNLGRKPSDYEGLIPANAKCLIGPSFALLRPEFAALRAQALVDRAGRGMKELLITMGGVDASDATSAILTALRDAPLPQDISITVVMGGNAPALERVQTLAATLPWATQVVVDIPDMAARMASADLAIGAAGSTTWERCCLGLPSVIVQIADNQADIAQALTAIEAASDPGLLTAPEFAQNLCNALEKASQNLPALLQKTATICDGDGVARVLDALHPSALHWRDATHADARRVWEWRQTANPQFQLDTKNTPYNDHYRWFLEALSDHRRVFRILMCGNLPCGYLRLDHISEAHSRVSLCLAKDSQGKGLGKLVMAETDRLGYALDLHALDAEIHPENIASNRIFTAAGYKQNGNLGEFATWRRDLRKKT